MIAFIGDHRASYGAEPIRRVLPVAPSTHHAHAAHRADPAKASPRAQRDVTLMAQIRRVHEENFEVYGARKVWRQLGREGVIVARCTVERLMRRMGLRGIVRGKETRTTIAGKALPCPADEVNRQFRAPRPNVLWVSDFTYVAPWQGNAHVAFVLDALEQALHDRRPAKGGLTRHSDRGSQHVSIRHTDRLLEAGIEPSVGSVGDSCDNALAETVIGLFKTEVIHRRGPWRSLEAVEYATPEWVDWHNTRRLLEPIGNMPPAEAEARYYTQSEPAALAA